MVFCAITVLLPASHVDVSYSSSAPCSSTSSHRGSIALSHSTDVYRGALGSGPRMMYEPCVPSLACRPMPCTMNRKNDMVAPGNPFGFEKQGTASQAAEPLRQNRGMTGKADCARCTVHSTSAAVAGDGGLCRMGRVLCTWKPKPVTRSGGRRNPCAG